MIEITAIDGVTVGPDQVYWIVVRSGDDYGLSAESHWHQRAGIGSTFQGQTPNPRVLSLCVYPGELATGSLSEWVAGGLALLRPYGALREIVGTYLGETVKTHVALDNPTLPSDRLAQIEVTAVAPSQFYRKTTPATSTASPLTNNGNAPAAPKITIRPTTGTVLRRRVTLTENTTRGLINHPLRLTVNTTGASVAAGSDVLLFDRGKSVLFQAQNLNNAASVIDYLCSLLPSEIGFVDVLYGSAVNNTITANKLDPAGFDWAHASFSNTNWVYRNTPGTLNGLYAPAIWETARALRRPGSWHRIAFGTPANALWAESIAAGAEQIALSGTAGITVVTQIKAGTTGAVKGFLTTSWSDAMAQFRKAGEAAWRQGDATFTIGVPNDLSDIDVDDAVQIVLWANGVAVTLDQEDTTTPVPIQVVLQSGEVPTISVGSAVTMARINGVLTNTITGDTITLTDVYIDADASGGLVIDTNAAPGERARIYPSLSTSPMYCPHDVGWQFSNRAGWPLVPGANAWTWTGDGSPVITIEFQDTYV